MWCLYVFVISLSIVDMNSRSIVLTCTKSLLSFNHCICTFDFWFLKFVTCLLTVTLHIVDVRLTCLINITYLLTYLLTYTGSAGWSMSLLQDKTWLPIMSRLSTLGCQTTADCSGLSLLFPHAGRGDIRSSPLAFIGHQLLPVRTAACSSSTEWLAGLRPRHDGVTLWHRAERHSRPRHPSAYSHPPPARGDSYIPAWSTSVSSQCRIQADSGVEKGEAGAAVRPGRHVPGGGILRGKNRNKNNKKLTKNLKFYTKI